MRVDYIKFFKKNKILMGIFRPIMPVIHFFKNRKARLIKNIIANVAKFQVNETIVFVPEFNSKFYICLNSDLYYRLIAFNSYEPVLVKYCMEYINKDKDVVDVGANIGFFTIMFAKLLKNKTVLAVEPTKNALYRLKKNIELNSVSNNVKIFEGVLTDKRGNIDVKIVKDKEEYSSVGKMSHPSIASEKYEIESVRSETLDNIIKLHNLNPGFIKIDVEGAEHLVIEGSSNTLKHNRPIILSELSDYLLKKNGSSFQQIVRVIQSYDYDVFDPIDPQSSLRTKSFGDILCFPKEMNVKLNKA